MGENGKTAIFCAGFGTADRMALRAYNALIQDVQRAFPRTFARVVFTSSCMAHLISQKGDPVPTLDEAFADLGAAQVDRVLIQPTHLIPGQSYSILKRSAGKWEKEGFSLHIGRPLLETEEDCKRAAEILIKLFPAENGTGFLLLGHGAAGAQGLYSIENRPYGILARQLRELGRPDMQVALMRGHNWPSALNESPGGGRQILLLPLLFAAGAHVKREGDGFDKWRETLESGGYSVELVNKGLGEYPEIREFYLERVRRLLDDAE